MKLSDLKNIKPKPINISADDKYVDYLYNLPQSKPKKQLWTVAGTVAAAVVVVLAVSIWSTIGRGIRADAVQVVEGSYKEIEPTKELNIKLNNEIFLKYDVFCFREFDENNPLSVHEILQLNRFAENAMTASDTATHGEYITNANGELAYLTGKEINEYAKKMFGTTPADKDAVYGCAVELGDVDYAGALIDKIKISTVDLTDGTKKIRMEYTDFAHLNVLEYIGTDLLSPIRFVAYYKDDTKLSKDYADSKIYKLLCDELDACDYIENYFLYLPEPPVKTDDGYSAKVILEYSFTDGRPHEILGSNTKYKDKQTLETVYNFKNTKNGLELIKEGIE